MPHDPQANKRNAIAFYRTAYLGDPAKAVEMYVGDEYIQHNPDVGDGTQPFIDYFTGMARQYPGKTIEFVRAVAQDDLVALRTHQTWPGSDVNQGADILVRSALSDEFAQASGRYFDNDAGRFAPPHADALDDGKCEAVVRAIGEVIVARNR